VYFSASGPQFNYVIIAGTIFSIAVSAVIYYLSGILTQRQKKGNEYFKTSLNMFKELSTDLKKDSFSHKEIPGMESNIIANDFSGLLNNIKLQIRCDEMMLFVQGEQQESYFRWNYGKYFSLPGYNINLDELLLNNENFQLLSVKKRPIAFSHEAKEDILNLKYIVFIPLFKNNQIAAILAGGRNSGNFSAEETEFMETLVSLYSWLIIGKINLLGYLDGIIQNNRLLFAAEIQGRLLSNKSLETDFAAAAIYTLPAKNVHSDFHGFFHDLKEKNITIYITDITGRNINHSSQAIIIIRSLLELLLRNRNDPGKALRILNNFFLKDDKLENFAQMLILQYDPLKKKVIFASAGICNVFIFRLATQQIEILESSELAIGIDEKTPYSSQEQDAQCGDIFLGCTDGLLETTDEQHNHFGKDRLAKILKENYFLPVVDLKDKIFQEISLFRGRAKNSDDMTTGIFKIY
jgi:serine phosphatase RsbU (regulator of sigma subunit)